MTAGQDIKGGASAPSTAGRTKFRRPAAQSIASLRAAMDHIEQRTADMDLASLRAPTKAQGDAIYERMTELQERRWVLGEKALEATPETADDLFLQLAYARFRLQYLYDNDPDCSDPKEDVPKCLHLCVAGLGHALNFLKDRCGADPIRAGAGAYCTPGEKGKSTAENTQEPLPTTLHIEFGRVVDPDSEAGKFSLPAGHELVLNPETRQFSMVLDRAPRDGESTACWGSVQAGFPSFCSWFRAVARDALRRAADAGVSCYFDLRMTYHISTPQEREQGGTPNAGGMAYLGLWRATSDGQLVRIGRPVS